VLSGIVGKVYRKIKGAEQNIHCSAPEIWQELGKLFLAGG
jgi:hypothetical protein